MCSEFILVIIIVIVIYFLYTKDNRIEWEAFDGKKYKIRDAKNKETNQKKADMLARLDNKARTIVKYMYDNKLPNGNIAKRTYSRFNGSSIGETPNGDSSAAYTINKGHIYVCLITKNKFNDENDAFFVILHELAHVMSNSYGHGEEFKTNFNFIVKLAVKLDIWKDPKYENRNVDYCGVNVTNSPCTGGSCEKDSLEHYYKESLMDYK